MAKSKSYIEIMKALNESAKTSTRYSKGDYVELATAFINEPDCEVDYYTNPSADSPVVVSKNPAKAYRDSLKDVVAKFGVDKNELAKLDAMEFSKKHAEAIVDVAQVVQHDYLSTGKKIRLPQLEENETTVTLGMAILPEKVEATKKIENGLQVPTGKTMKTAERSVLKAGNKVPGWLKAEVK